MHCYCSARILLLWREGIWKLGISAVAWSSAEGLLLGTCSAGSTTASKRLSEDKSNLGSYKGTLHTLVPTQLLTFGHLVLSVIPWGIGDIHTGSTTGPVGGIYNLLEQQLEVRQHVLVS